ncbi:MAG: zinc ABC transporter substrate-binding protein [Wenzhouxiangella sp.]|jgi:manganese/iron transport system substrate-binding protein|nr:zinc ABC transporter substrate-binding protein [Wenzhouxiangella sp.]
MRKWILCLFAALISTTVWAEDRPTVVVTFSILEDLAATVAGEHAEVISLTPRGAEVHEYELRPADFRALERAELVFYNGLSLEQWMGQVRAVVADHVPVVGVAAQSGVETLPIVSGEYRGQADPHAWMDPRRAGEYARAMAQALARVMPEHAASFHANAESYRDELNQLYREMAEALDEIPPQRRILISSEAAFVYFAQAFGFSHDGIWGNNAETEGAPRQLMRIIDLIDQRRPPALFWESTVSSRTVEAVSADTGVPYYGPLYVDSLGEAGSVAGSYPGMMRENVRVLVEALLDER